jgi:tol-pal system protein YbgF
MLLLSGSVMAQQTLSPGTSSGNSATLQRPPGAASSGTQATASPPRRPVPATQQVAPSANQTLLQLLNQLTSLQQEVQQLRGEIEQQNHDVETIKQRQRDLYLDLDRRLQRLEVAGTPPAPAPTGGSSSAPAPAPSPAPSAASAGDEREAYQTAFNLLKDGQYPQAIGSFQNFLSRFPNGAYADNAQYWLGEARYVSREFQPAVSEFETVIKRFPQSPKIPDAKLKIGYAKYELGDNSGARAILQEITTQHAETTAARLAQRRLQKMESEGR